MTAPVVKPNQQDTQLTHFEVERPGRKFPLCILAADLELPMNVGSLFRIADALGVESLYLCGDTPLPPDRKIKKTARSTEKHVPFVYRENALDAIRELRAKGYLIVSLELTSDSVDIRRFAPPPQRKICLVVGAENEGIAQAILDASDVTVHIPMFGNNSSMNVATACAIALFELVRAYAP
jgi:tRNA G18 (ribose-2'-O)-methylase SpoU